MASFRQGLRKEKDLVAFEHVKPEEEVDFVVIEDRERACEELSQKYFGKLKIFFSNFFRNLHVDRMDATKDLGLPHA